jgi:hypothetical protein
VFHHRSERNTSATEQGFDRAGVQNLQRFDPKHQLRVAASNILGQDWINESSYTDDIGTVARRGIYPGTVIVRATVEMKF